ncbi:MAG: SUMF1/EgtB/PvdO family nonheme iron enzyme [Verrucomicrobia bacterium]|nr:SUMF1/EgtB/PvdO family nonheme iron enzyme [Verrucomicrobiota bacterium]
MKMRSRLLGIIALAAVSLAATHCRRTRQVPAATAPENPPVTETRKPPTPEQPPAAETRKPPAPEQPPATGTPKAAELPGFVLIPAGDFTMGDSLDGDKDARPHQVNVSAFYMGQKEVTKAEWDAVRTWAVSHGYADLAEGAGKAPEHPVQTVSWWDVVKWCNARSEQEELTPCFTVDGAVMRSGTTAPSVNWAVNGYRLPREAEWEKAARGGLSGKRFPWGDSISHTQANFRNDGEEPYQTGTTGFHPTYGTGSEPYTSPVGSFTANGYGLHDMAGNVWEWCWDWHGTYAFGVQTDPRGASSSSYRVIRGGSWYSYAVICRAAGRYGSYYPSSTTPDLGLRLACSSVPKQQPGAERTERNRK